MCPASLFLYFHARRPLAPLNLFIIVSKRPGAAVLWTCNYEILAHLDSSLRLSGNPCQIVPFRESKHTYS